MIDQLSFDEPKCLSRPTKCAQKQKIPATKVSFPEIFYSYSVSSQKNELNKKMKNRVQEITGSCGCIITSFAEPPTSTFQYFCNNICLNIQRCSLLIADITPTEGRIASNIIHEIGLAQGLRKNVILLTCEKEFDLIESIFSNLKGFEFYLFPDDLDKLFDYIREILKNSLPEIHIISDAYDFQQYCLKLEKKVYSRDFYSTVIPSMMRDMPLQRNIVEKREIYPFRNDLSYTEKYINTVNERMQCFIDILEYAQSIKDEEIGKKILFRDIYIKKDLDRYAEKGLMEGKELPDNPDEVISRFRGIINSLITFHTHYEVGLLVGMEAPYKFLIKHDCGVVIDNPIRRTSKNALAIFSTIKSFVSENQSLFNKLWEMPNTEKNKEKVLEELGKLLKMAEERTE